MAAKLQLIETYQQDMKDDSLSQHTRDTYLFGIKQFCERYTEFNAENIRDYKLWLIENFSPKTVNLRLQAINYYLKRHEKEIKTVKSVKVQTKPFLENVISKADYEFLKKQLLKDNKKRDYFIVRFMGATGARVSELIQFKVEHVIAGYFDLYGKGGKMRRVYIPQKLKMACIEWLNEIEKDTGYLFTNHKNGEQITTRGIANMLQNMAEKYKLDKKCMHPHSFRHRFAKNFLEKNQDISFLADLMGHESIETTRIYLRKSATEQREIIDTIIDW